MPRYGQRSDPQTHAAEILMMASVGWMIVGVSRFSKRTSRGPYRTAPCMIFLPYFDCLTISSSITTLDVNICGGHWRVAPIYLQKAPFFWNAMCTLSALIRIVVAR